MSKDIQSCPGCGIPLQNESQDQPGFFREPDGKTEHQKKVYCQRCFRLKHYNTMSENREESQAFDVLERVQKEEGSIMMVVDLFDLEGSFIPGISRLTNRDDVFVVVNKSDIFGNQLKQGPLLQKLYRHMRAEGVRPREIHLVSATQNKGIDTLWQDMRKERKWIILGAVNVGKSSLVNALISHVQQKQGDIIASNMPHTTQGFITIPITSRVTLIDTPGIIKRHHIGESLQTHSQSLVLPKKQVIPRVYQIEAGQTLFIGGLAGIQYLEGERLPFVCYFSENLKVHRRKSDQDLVFFQKHLGSLLTPPNEEEAVDWKTRQTSISVPGDGKKYEVVIPGLGFIQIKGQARLRFILPLASTVICREAII